MNLALVTSLVEAMRPRQWSKNVVIFAGVLFSLQVLQPIPLMRSALAFIFFCLVSGCVYILNDVSDYERDLVHPEKRKRPIASGRLPRRFAAIFATVLIIVVAGASIRLSPSFGAIALFYFFMNLGYSFYLKNIVILDVLIIALGFVLRAVAGALVIHVQISEWLLVCTFFLALFLALCKRRHELRLIEDKAANHRAVLQDYSAHLVDQMIAVATASALMSYALYTISENVEQKFHTDKLIFTIPFVLFAIFRYLYLVHNQNLGGSPEKVFIQDRGMLIDIILWVLTVFIILYLAPILS